MLDERSDRRRRRDLALRLVLSAGALVVAGAVAAGGSTLAAVRAGRGTVRDPGFAPGAVVLARVDAAPFLSFRNLAIGASRSGRLTIANEGSSAGELVLSASIRPSPLARQLRLEISTGGRAIYRGSLDALRSVRGGRIEPGGTRTFAFRLSLPSTGSAARDDRLQGGSVEASFRWLAAAA